MAYESILTNVGRQKIASATPEHQLKIHRLAVGDGNGGYSPLDPDMNSLVNEVWRGPASAPIRDRNDPTILIFEAIIPPDVGGFFIREAGIFDDTGDLIAVGHTAQIEKPDDSSGSPISLTVRFRVQLENADHFDLIYNDEVPIDHSGLDNRDAPDSHPISAITGLNNALNGKADKSTFVFAGTGLKGGGALSSNVTLSVDFDTVHDALGLGTAATRDVTTSPTDTTPGRVLKVGDFGVGDTISIPQGANLNDYITPGEYFQTTNANANPELNYPAQLAGSLKVIRSTVSGCVQEYTTHGNTHRKFFRSLHNGVWSSWVEFYHSGWNLVTPIGVEQTWQDVAAQRALDTTYTNTTGRPIMVAVSLQALGASGAENFFEFFVDNVLVGDARLTPFGSELAIGARMSLYAIVPAGSSYRVTRTIGIGGIVYWSELR